MFEALRAIFRRKPQASAPHPPSESHAPGHDQISQIALNEAIREIEKRREHERGRKSKKGKENYDEALANELIKELKSVPPGSPLYNIQFDPRTLVNQPGLVNLLYEVRDADKIRHDREGAEYLLKKLKDVVFFQRQVSGKDKKALEIIGERLKLQAKERLENGDNRIVRYEEELQKLDEKNAWEEPPKTSREERKDKLEKRVKIPESQKGGYFPLDVTGYYGDGDPNLHREIKDIIEKVKAEIEADPDNHRFKDISLSDVTEKDLRYEGGIRRLRKAEVAWRAVTDEMNKVVQESRKKSDPKMHIDIKEILPYELNIRKYLRKLTDTEGRFDAYGQLKSFGINVDAIREAANSNDGQRKNSVYEQTFYRLLQRPLSDPAEQHFKTFSLYETEAMQEFFELISEYEGGFEEAGRLRNKMYGIFAAHDAVLIAEHPEGNEEAYQTLTTFARNSHTVDTLEDPLAEQLIGIYERVLMDILNTHDRRIPAAWVENRGRGEPAGNSLWDTMVQERFLQMVDAGVIYDAKRKPVTGEVERDEKGIIKWDYTRPVKRSWFAGEGKWRLLAAMQQAKGFGILDTRLIEIFALQRVPSFQDPALQANWFDGDRVFCSVPYEGLARFINPLHLFAKWGVADDKFRTYWNFIIHEEDEDFRAATFTVNEPKQVFNAIYNGTFEDKYPEQAERFLDKMAYGRFSGRFGPWTTFGVRDSIIGMSDKEREYLGGSIRAAYMNGVWAEEDVREHLVEERFKKLFKRQLLAEGKLKMVNGMVDEDWFQKEWRKVGKHIDPDKGVFTVKLNQEWKELKEKQEVKDFITELTNIYHAFTWVQMAQRSPHIVARNVNVYEDVLGKLRKRSLREKILEEMFPGLDLEHEFHTGENPKPPRERWFALISQLEGDIDTVVHRAMYDEHGPRNITDEDFDSIKAFDEKGNVDQAESLRRQKRAKEYYRKTKLAIMGAWDENKWLDELGLHYEGERLEVTWDKIFDKKALKLKKYGPGKQLHHKRVLSLAKADADRDPNARPYFQLNHKDFIGKKHRYLMSTEDVVWHRLELINLGYRQWARRGGDFNAHAKGLKATMKYLTRNLSMSGDMKPIFESFHEISEAYEGDDKAFSERMLYMHAQATAKMFKQDWRFSKTGPIGQFAALFADSSVAQKIAGRLAGAAWNSNKLFEFAHQLGAQNLLPWKPETFMGEGPFPFNVEDFEKEVGATKKHVLWEALTLAAFIAIVLTLWRAFTAKEEGSEGQ